MLKFVGGAFIVVCGTLGGIYFSLRSRRKVEFLEQYIVFLTQVQTMISYGGMSVREIFGEIKNVPLADGILRDTEVYMNEGEAIETAWKKAVEKNMKELHFEKSDTEMIEYFGNTFGVSDREGELSKIKLHEELVRERWNILKNEMLSKCRVYRIVGMFCGVLTAVLIC